MLILVRSILRRASAALSGTGLARTKVARSSWLLRRAVVNFMIAKLLEEEMGSFEYCEYGNLQVRR